jgi:hypothetical protein
VDGGLGRIPKQQAPNYKQSPNANEPNVARAPFGALNVGIWKLFGALYVVLVISAVAAWRSIRL